MTGYAATAVTSPGIYAYNALFGTTIDPAVVGTALADGVWSLFGYDVDAPAIGIRLRAVGRTTR